MTIGGDEALLDVRTVSSVATDQRFRLASGKRQHQASVCRIGTASPFEGKEHGRDIYAKMRDFWFDGARVQNNIEGKMAGSEE